MRTTLFLIRYATDKSGKISQDQLFNMVKDFADEIGAPGDHCNDCVRYILALFNADDESTLDMFVSYKTGCLHIDWIDKSHDVLKSL